VIRFRQGPADPGSAAVFVALIVVVVLGALLWDSRRSANDD